MRRTTLALLSAYAGTASAEDVSPLAALMQPTANAKALEYNCSIAIAVAFSNGTSATVVAGEKDMEQHIPAQPSDKFIWGSITKILTGSSILKAQEAGKLKITDPIVPYIDPILKKMAASDPSMKFSSLEDLFGSNVSKVTIENLARMQSGIPDYDTAKPEGSHPTDSFRATCYKDSKRDYAPQDMLGLPWVATKQLDFEPGTKVSYSSTNFVLLGLLLAQLDNATWSTYNQAAIVPPSARDDTVFALTGPPSQWTDVRGYDRTAYNGQDPTARPGVDVSNIDCVYAGWTASDYTASVQNAADFALDVYGPNSPILLPASQQIMTPRPQDDFYSFATFNMDHYTGLNASKTPYGVAYGHLGATYGYDSIVLFYPALNMTMAVASNIETTNQVQPADTACTLYNIIRSNVVGEPPKICKYENYGYWGYCVCI